MSDSFISLLRHGEAQGAGRFRGAHDDPLSDLGWAQMWAQVRRRGLDRQFDRLVSAPSRRCAEFAERLGRQRGLPVRLEADLGERRLGDWDGLPAHQIPVVELTRFWDDPIAYAPPNAEVFEAFRWRVLKTWRALRADAQGHTLVVTHAGVVRIVLAEVLGLGDQSGLLVEVPDAALTVFRIPVEPGRPSLMLHCGTPDPGTP